MPVLKVHLQEWLASPDEQFCSRLMLFFQIRFDSQTDRQIHSLETELSKLRLLHNKGKDRMRELEREILHFQKVSISLLFALFSSFGRAPAGLCHGLMSVVRPSVR